MLLLCTQQLRQYRFCPSWYFCTLSLHHEYCFCLLFCFSLKEMLFELLAGVCFFTCVIHLHMGDHKECQESQLKKTLHGCIIRMRFCTVPPHGHHPQPDREALKFFLKSWSSWEEPMWTWDARKVLQQQVADKSPMPDLISHGRPWVGKVAIERMSVESQNSRAFKPVLTLRQFPGRPDVAIRLSLALEKLTYLWQV